MAKKIKNSAPVTKKDEGQKAPKFKLRAVYVKDISFESPLAPSIFAKEIPTPKIGLEINVLVDRLDANAFEVAIKVEAEARLADNKILFLLELLQAGVFVLNPALGEEESKKILASDCTAALFPFVRQNVAELTRNGGFAPLLLDQIEFNS